MPGPRRTLRLRQLVAAPDTPAEDVVLRLARPRSLWPSRLGSLLWRTDAPTLTVRADSLVYRYPRLLTRPVTIARDNVTTVWLRDFYRVRWNEPAWPVSNAYAPDLGGIGGRKAHNLLISFRRTVPIGDDVGWLRLFSMDLGLGRRTTYHATRWTHARAVWGLVEDVSLAREAFHGWPTSDRISDDDWDWVQAWADRQRMLPPSWRKAPIRRPPR